MRTSYVKHVIKHRIDNYAYRIDRKLHPTRTLKGQRVVVGSDNLLTLMDGEKVVYSYTDLNCQFLRFIGNVSINNRSMLDGYGTDIRQTIWAFDLSKEWDDDTPTPIYTRVHDNTVWVSHSPEAIHEAIRNECDHGCVITR